MQDTIFASLFQHNDIEMSLDIPFQEALGGSHRRLTVLSNTGCPSCQAQGVVEGFFTSKRCEMCEGNGVVPCQRQVLIAIPAGIRDGARLHIPGEGLLGLLGTQRGDLYVTLRVMQAPLPAQRVIAAPPPRIINPPPTPIVQRAPINHNAPTIEDLSLLGVPSQLGNYRIIRQIGAGGGGTVYLGQHTRLQTYAAIKVLGGQITPEHEEAFLHEAQTLARLKHPHILRVLDFGTEGNTPFLVMDYAQSGSLRDLHKKGSQIAPHLVASYIGQVASALHYAHSQRIIHRDIKPDNMLVDQPGTSVSQTIILLSDFGIAVAAHSTRSQKLEEPYGTAFYVAPEQLQGHPRPASDQYALGIVAYEWLCGQVPFNGTQIEVLAQHCTTPPAPLRKWNATLSPAIERVVLKSLAKDPTQRFDSVLAFAHAFENAL